MSAKSGIIRNLDDYHNFMRTHAAANWTVPPDHFRPYDFPFVVSIEWDRRNMLVQDFTHLRDFEETDGSGASRQQFREACIWSFGALAKMRRKLLNMAGDIEDKLADPEIKNGPFVDKEADECLELLEHQLRTIWTASLIGSEALSNVLTDDEQTAAIQPQKGGEKEHSS